MNTANDNDCASNTVITRHELNEALNMGQSVTTYLESAVFVFQTREDAKKIALHLASLMPDPAPVLTGLLEMLLNAVEHGSLNIGAELKNALIEQDNLETEISDRYLMPIYKDRKVTLEYSVDKGRFKFRVTDEGDGFAAEEYFKECETSPDKRGRGIMMARHCFDTVAYSDDGRTVELELFKQA